MATREALIKVTIDPIPEGHGKDFEEWCERYECTPLGYSPRRAWCGLYGTYLRGNYIGMAETATGERFLVEEDDIPEPNMTMIHEKTYNYLNAVERWAHSWGMEASELKEYGYEHSDG